VPLPDLLHLVRRQADPPADVSDLDAVLVDHQRDAEPPHRRPDGDGEREHHQGDDRRAVEEEGGHDRRHHPGSHEHQDHPGADSQRRELEAGARGRNGHRPAPERRTTPALAPGSSVNRMTVGISDPARPR
jgi:hypothetical protein